VPHPFRAFCEKGGKAKSLGTSILEPAQSSRRLPQAQKGHSACAEWPLGLKALPDRFT